MKPLFRATLLGVWLLTLRVGAQQYDIRVFGVEDGLPGSTVNAIAQDSAGFLWVETDGGLCRFDGRNFWATLPGSGPRFEPQRAIASTRPKVEAPQATCELISSISGEYWRGTAVGLRVYSSSASIAPSLTLRWDNGLPSNWITCLYEDASGVIWIGTRQGGLCRYTGAARMYYGTDGGIEAQTSAFLIQDERGAHMGTGITGTWYKYNGGGGAAHAQITGNCLALLSKDRILVGTDSGAVVIPCFQGGYLSLSPANRILVPWSIAQCLPVGESGVWAATEKGIISVDADLNWIRVSKDTTEATTLAIERDTMLIGTHHGLYSAPLDNSSANWTPIIRAGEEDITCLAVDRGNNIWIGTEASGLVRYRNGSTQRRTTRDGLASDRIRQLLLDAYQNLWVGTDRGFNLLELDELQEEVISTKYYGLEEGFPGIEAMPNACMLDTDSSLWFGTTRGTIHFDPRKVLEDPIAPRTRVTDVALFFEHPDWRPWSDTLNADGLPLGLRLPYHKNHLTFTFTGLSLAYPEKVRFQYKLEGRDADWSPITKEDHVTFSGLEPGEYAFLVKARNGSGVWNDEPARYSFVITPPFWATTGFRVSGGAALLLGFFGLQRVRDRRSRKARERLERIVATRTRELTEEKHRSDTLLLNILPETTAAELKEFGSAQARSYANCTVLFSDFQGFTVLSEQFEATGIVTELDRFFRAFDRITDKFGTEKIKTIGDAYMCASGVPEPSPTHALDAMLMALEMLSVVDGINALRESEGHPAWPIRIGLNSGPLIAGVVGEKKFAYDVWGDTVNLASRMESNGAPGRVNVTDNVLKHVEAYVMCEARGKVTIKGKGEIESWFVDRLRPEYSADEQGRMANERLMDIRNAIRTA